MGSLKNIIDELAKHSLLVYFIIIWGASMFLYSVARLGTYGLSVEEITDVTWILGNIFDLGAGVFLMIFGIKLLITNFLDVIQTEKALVYFLILWAGSFFFWGLDGLLSYSGLIFILGALGSFVAGIILALFGWKLLNEKESITT